MITSRLVGHRNIKKKNARTLKSTKPYFSDGAKVFRNPVYLTNETIQDVTRDDLIKYFRTLTPEQLLKRQSLSGFDITSDKAYELLDILSDYDFSTELNNILLEYVILMTDGKLPANYVRKVADTWKKDNIFDIDKAIQQTKLIERLKNENNTSHQVNDYIRRDIIKHASQPKDSFQEAVEAGYTDQETANFIRSLVQST